MELILSSCPNKTMTLATESMSLGHNSNNARHTNTVTNTVMAL